MKKLVLMLLVSLLALTSCQPKNDNESKNDNNITIKTNQLASKEEAIRPTDGQDETVDSEDTEDFEPWVLEDFLGDLINDLNEEQKAAIELVMNKINEEEGKASYDDQVVSDLYDQVDDMLTTYLGFEDQEEEMEYEPWTAELYLGLDYEALTGDQIDQVNQYLDQINEAERDFDEGDYDEIQGLYTQLNQLLRDFGLRVAISSYAELIQLNPDAFTQEEADALLDLDQKMTDIYNEDPASQALDSLYEDLEAMLEKAGFDPVDIIDQVETGAMNYAIFQVEAGKVTFKGDASAIDPEDMKKYLFLVDQARKVVTQDQMTYIQYFVVNTDGPGNVLAYVSQENDTLTKWRMVLDLKDAFDSEGNYLQEYDETIVHEFGHIISLNSSQMQKQSTGTYENEEGNLKAESFLNQFYQTFWLDIAEDHKAAVDQDPDYGSYDFYDQHPDQFVSDYAATNPEEDFAETFRIFVYAQDAQGDDLKDMKVKWMFENDDLMAMRDHIRQVLNID